MAEDDDGWMETQGGSLDAEIARREEEVRQHASGSRGEGRKTRQPAGTAPAASERASCGAGQESGSSDSEGGSVGGSAEERVQVGRLYHVWRFVCPAAEPWLGF